MKILDQKNALEQKVLGISQHFIDLIPNNIAIVTYLSLRITPWNVNVLNVSIDVPTRSYYRERNFGRDFDVISLSLCQ